MNDNPEGFFINKSPFTSVYKSNSSNEFVSLSNEAIATYVALRSIQGSNQKKTIYVSPKSLCFELYGDMYRTRNDIEKIKIGLYQLDDVNLITILKEDGKSGYILDISNLYESNPEIDYHCYIFRSEILAIFTITKSFDRYSILRYFLCLIGSINTKASIGRGDNAKKNFVGMISIQYLAHQAMITDKTALQYNALLEGLHLIYFERSGTYRITKDGSTKTQPAHYGRWKDAAFIKQYADLENRKYRDNSEYIKKSSLADIQKSLIMRYHALEKGKEYTDEEKLEMLAIMAARNSFFTELAKETEDEKRRKAFESKVKILPLLHEWMKTYSANHPESESEFNDIAMKYYEQFCKEKHTYEKKTSKNVDNIQTEKTSQHSKA